MKLRYRLFLWVALVFTIVFFASFYMENRLTESNLKETYQELVQKLDELNDEKTKAIEVYLGDMLYKLQAEVDAVLQGVSKYPLVRKGFVPTQENLKNENWLQSASLMITNKWIDYIQSTNETDLMSEIIMDEDNLNDTLHFPVHDLFHFVAIRKKDGWSEPYIGIVLDMSSLHGNEDDPSDKSDQYYVYFSPQVILNFKVDIDSAKSLDLSINFLEPFLKWLESPRERFFLGDFLAKILNAQKFLKNNPTILPSEEHWRGMIQKSLKEFNPSKSQKYSFFEKTALGKSSQDLYDSNQVRYYVEGYLEHYSKVGLIWGLSTLTYSNLFGKNPLGAKAPAGMGILDQESNWGKGLFSSKVFFNELHYNVVKAVKEMEQLPVDFLTTHFNVIAPLNMDHVFFGNSLKLVSGSGESQRTGYLTIGTHGGPVLESLARSTHQIALFISGNRIITVSNPDGSTMEDRSWFHIPVESLLSKPSGIIDVGGKEFFFLHIVPNKNIDLHFFIFNPKEKEFAFINSVNEGAREIIRKLSFQMRIAAIGGLLFVLIFLNNISKRITKPITHLAAVTEKVAEGNLEEITIPEEANKKTKDEIYSLYHSFFEMVKGLREKEKVKGVLNKVVSQEIAEEALKGNIQLGGEEKNVTVMFADIRGFTKMTEKMNPKEVIQFVNKCMTKVSEKIDKYEGVIDKYVGDEVMALFGAPIEKKESAIHAIESGLETIEVLKQWNEERKKDSLPEIAMGIGIHTGNVVAGNMGAENRLNYTVLGANVNLAARICSQAKGMQILISEETLHSEGVKERFICKKLQAIELKGFTTPVNVYEVKGYKT